MESKDLTSFILTAFLIAIGTIRALGFNLWGSAMFEGATWKQR